MSSDADPTPADNAQANASQRPDPLADTTDAGPSGTRSDRKRAAIIAAAREAFLKDGFGATSMDRIAALADVSKRTVYNHFENKEALFSAFIRDFYKDLLDGDRFVLNPAAPPGKALRSFAAALLNELARPDRQDLIRLVIAESRRFPQLSALYFAEGKEPAVGKLATYLAQQVERGSLAIPDVPLAAQQFLGMLKESWFWPFVLGLQPAQDGDIIVEQAVTTFLARYAASAGGEIGHGAA